MQPVRLSCIRGKVAFARTGADAGGIGTTAFARGPNDSNVLWQRESQAWTISSCMAMMAAKGLFMSYSRPGLSHAFSDGSGLYQVFFNR
jgi:hypothetical protein